MDIAHTAIISAYFIGLTYRLVCKRFSNFPLSHENKDRILKNFSDKEISVVNFKISSFVYDILDLIRKTPDLGMHKYSLFCLSFNNPETFPLRQIKEDYSAYGIFPYNIYRIGCFRYVNVDPMLAVNVAQELICSTELGSPYSSGMSEISSKGYHPLFLGKLKQYLREVENPFQHLQKACGVGIYNYQQRKQLCHILKLFVGKRNLSSRDIYCLFLDDIDTLRKYLDLGQYKELADSYLLLNISCHRKSRTLMRKFFNLFFSYYHLIEYGTYNINHMFNIELGRYEKSKDGKKYRTFIKEVREAKPGMKKKEM